MYSQKQLQSECPTRVSFQQGLQIQKNNQVVKISYESKKSPELKKLIVINSTVSDADRLYAVNIYLDEWDEQPDTGRIAMKYCSCSEGNGLCKHSIGTLIKYFEIRDNGADPQSYSMSMEKKNITDDSFKNLLSARYNKKKATIKAKNKAYKLHLVPFLHANDVTIDVEFKAGTDKLYIVKKINEYVKTVRGNQTVMYGKTQKVFHSTEMFDDQSKRYLSFITDLEEKRIALGQIIRPGEEQRIVSLKGDLLDEFLISAKDDIVSFNETDRLKIVEKAPELSYKIQPSNDGLLITGSFPKTYIGSKYVAFFFDGELDFAKRDVFSQVEDFISYLSRNVTDEIFISEEDMHLFVRELLPAMKNVFMVDDSEFDYTKYLPEKAKIRIYIDTFKKDSVSCKLVAAYGDREFNVFEDTGAIDNFRDDIQELEACETVKKYFNKFDASDSLAILTFAEEEQFFNFIKKDVYELGSVGEIFVSDKIKNIKVKSTSSINAGISLKGDLLSVNVQSDDFTEEQIDEILKRYDRKKKFFRLKDGTFVDVDEEKIEGLANIAKTLHESGEEFRDGEAVLPKFRALFLENELSKGNLKTDKSKDFIELVGCMKNYSDKELKVPASLKDSLREYQLQGFRWIKNLKLNGFGGILSDEMGLGKTLQTIAFMLSEYEEGEKRCSLVICPASLVYNWKNEFEKFAPKLKTLVVSGKQEERARLIENVKPKTIMIASFDLLKHDIEMYEKIDFAVQIIDEAQYIKNSATLSSKAVKKITSGFRLALTGTPIENRLSELWSIFDYLMTGFLHEYRTFRENFEVPIVQFKSTEELTKLQQLISPFVLRRLKQDVLKDLPPKIEETFMTELTGEQKDIYVSTLKDIKKRINSKTDEELNRGKTQILADIMKLRQICCDPSLCFENYEAGSAKSDLCMDLIQRAIDGGHKILLFSQFTTMLGLLQERLRNAGIEYLSLDGQTPTQKRKEIVDEFNEGNIPVFCISLRAGGTGLNLTAADIVIHFDPWWNMAVQEQATDRAHRLGQTKTVNVYKLIAKGTIEEGIMNLQKKKTTLAGDILSSAAFGQMPLTKEDLLTLLNY